MSCQSAVYEWTAAVTSKLPHLSKPQAAVLVMWSLGMVLARSCALSAVSTFLASGLGHKENTVRQQLREWCYDACDKRGAKRRDLDVEGCFVPLLRWVLNRWEGTQLAVALDATTLGSLFVVLAISVVYRGCAIPVAWTILPATEKHAWREEWLRMLAQFKGVVPAHYTVIVLADRGLYARWLFRAIVDLHWHPFLRINAGGTFHPEDKGRFYPLSSFAPTVGSRWSGNGIAFKAADSRLKCTLLACWEEGYKEQWFILTDLPPEASQACWYGLRAWIEQGFKITKRAGWQWQRTKMTDPKRAARLWLAVAVATLWLLSVGGVADETIPTSTLWDVTAALAQQKRQRAATRLRLVSVFRRGLARILAALINQAPLPVGIFIPEPWPKLPPIPLQTHTHLRAMQDAAA